MNAWDDIKFFKPSEFDSPDLPGSGANMHLEFIKVLDVIRLKCSFPFTINSGFRTPEHNAAVGGKPDSEHLQGLAADIAIPDSTQRKWIIQKSLENGIRRIGIGDTFVHLGFSMDLPQDVIWLYGSKGD